MPVHPALQGNAAPTVPPVPFGVSGPHDGPMAHASPVATRPVAVRVRWGGGQPRAWSGTIAVVDETGRPPRVTEWRTLSTDADAAAMVHAEGGRLVVHQPRPVASDGVELIVPDAHGWRIVAALGPAGSATPPDAALDVAVVDLLAQEATQPLDGDGNRLVMRPAPGEELRATVEAADGGGAVCRPGDRVRIVVDPLLPARADGTAGVELRLRLKSSKDGAEIDARTARLVPLAVSGAATPAAGRRPVRFDTVRFDLVLPQIEADWTVELEAVEGSGLGWNRRVAGRTLMLTTLDSERPAADAAAWRMVYELDPANPRLHERLRRLSAVGLSTVPMPHVPLPSITRPALPRLPQIPLPAVPLPSVPLPSAQPLQAFVPRLSGLLAAGHSRVEPHPLGPMLRLPPAEAADKPTWEGVVVAGAQPAMPHVVEIEFPTDQDAAVAVAVLEVDASGSRVESRSAGGFRLRRGSPAEGPRLDVYRFVFWPATRHPVVLIANRTPSAPALLGHVRILAGPGRLSAVAPATGRRVHAFLDDPSFRRFGGGDDPVSRVTAVARSAEVIAAQGAAGALVVVQAEGAALWPSRALRLAPRWVGDGDDASAPVAAPDLLAAVCRAYEREGLRLVPGVSCDAPLPALEAELAAGGAAAAGIACVGRDGRPLRIGASAATHYNVLDPRVQQAVEEVVRELAARLRASAAVDGVALVMPHDGWLHLPGVAWCLDDATFARFRAVAGVEEPTGGDDRFAARAALVEGPLRERWIDWRAAEVARFHARLAEVLAEHGDNWSLYVVPTTLCATGAVAERLRPALVELEETAADAVIREIGLDPVRSTAHRRVVFVAPRMEGGRGLAGRGVVAAGNAAAARAAAAAARRGVVVLERGQPLDIRSMVPHGPFGAAQAEEPLQVLTIATGAEAGRPLAEAFAVADAEAVFDARLGLALPEVRPLDRAAIESLPAAPLAALVGTSATLAVRTTRRDATWVHVVNAAAVPVRATLAVDRPTTDVMDMASGAALDARAGMVTVDLSPWGMRALRLGGDVTVTNARVEYDNALTAAVANRVANLHRRREALDHPAPIDVLDNPGFELGDGGDVGQPAAAATGWELVEPRRGAVATVSGAGGSARAASFSSINGLATLRSNPFPPPRSGRVSVAAWLRIRAGDPQPPLRVAIEGVCADREFYRFAAVGGPSGGRPLSEEWQQFVLQVGDLPETGLESLRVRFDLLGPGTVEIDDVRVYDLAFTEPERAWLSRQIGSLEASLAAGDVGACLPALDSHWPMFLEAHVPVPPPPEPPPATAVDPAPVAPAERTGVLDRVWRLWK